MIVSVVMHNIKNLQLNNPWYNKEHGYVTLLSVLIVGAVGIAVTATLLLSGVIATQNSIVFTQSNQAQALSHACTEEALQQIRDLSSYTGTGSLVFTNGSCTYTVTNLGGTDRNILSTGIVNTIVRKEQVRITKINPMIEVVSWQEVES